MDRFERNLGCAALSVWAIGFVLALALNVVIIWAIIKAVLYFT